MPIKKTSFSGNLKDFFNKSFLFFFKRFLLYFLVPIIMFFMSALFIYQYYVSYFEQEIKNNYSNALASISDTVDNIFYEILKTSTLLSLDTNIKDIITSDSPIDEGYVKIQDCIQALQSFRVSKNYIDSVFILDKSDKMVISSDGTMDSDIFFNNYYRYEKYSEDYWNNLVLKSNIFRIMEPSRVTGTSNYKSMNVVPIIQPCIGRYFTKALFVINVNGSKLNEVIDKYKLTPNSTLLVFDNNGTVYSDTNPERNISPIINTVLGEKKEGVFYSNVDGARMLEIVHISNAVSKEFYYVACVPLGDFYSKFSYLKILAYSISIVTLILSLFFSVFMADKLYSPIKNLVNIMKQKTESYPESNPTSNEFEFLNEGIHNMIHSTENLSENLSSVLPLAYEQCLQKILNQQEFLNEENAKDLLSKVGILFEYPYFIIAVIQLSFTKHFYESFQRDEQILVYTGTLKIAASIFPEEYHVHSFTIEKDKYCFIINLPGKEPAQKIKEYIKRLYDIYMNDVELLNLYSGIGQVYENIAGMRKSYKEALNALSSISRFSHEGIKIFEQEENRAQYTYSIEEENKLYNFLASGRKDEVSMLLTHIINRNIQNRISDLYRKELYAQLYLVGQRVLEKKNSSPEKLMGDSYLNIFSDYVQIPIKDIEDYVIQFLNETASLGSESGSKIDISQIKEYINLHFHEDIYLEQLAGMYHTSAPYLSRLLKECLGMPFQHYLASIRIFRAKELLAESKKSINVIAVETGFNSRNTFIRMFKKLEGITPSEYRGMKSG